MKILVFELNRKLFGIDISYVLSIEKKPKIISVPNAPYYVDGITRLRDQVMPVYSLTKKFHYAELESGEDYVIIETEETNVVFHVGSVQKMIDVDDNQVISIQNDILQEQKNLYKVISHENDIIILLKVNSIITEQDKKYFENECNKEVHV